MASTGFGPASRQLRGLFEGRSAASLEDGQLLARFEADRDEAAFEALLTRHGPTVLAICRGVLGNEHDAEDAFQATFLVLARKARSVRGRDSLGGWLHRVARRASVRASVEAKRRRRKEAEAATIAPNASPRPDPDPDPELASLLHEEIDRLPEGQRLPVVLCDLEGLTYDQAARQLRWTEPTLRNRLARGRRKLKARLTCRGVTATAIGGLAAASASAAVPPSLARSTLSAATGGPASASAVPLTHTLLRGMLMTKFKIASAASLAALVLVSAGLIAAAGRPDGPKPAMKPPATSRGVPEEAQAPSPRPGDLIEVRGIVVGPDGRPVAGATVHAVVPAPVPETTSGPDGRFVLRAPHPEPASMRRLLKQYPQVIASAPGFGLNRAAPPYNAPPAGELTIRLVEEGPAIEGRIIDLEGRPVAGAKVHPNVVYYADGGSLDPWLASKREKNAREFNGLWGIVLMKGEVETGPDGRFRLAGLGRERVASLFVTGPSIASTSVNVLLRDGPAIPGPDRSGNPVGPVVLHWSKFDAIVPPTKPIEGTVRDEDTGRPIEGLTLLARVFDPYNPENGAISARTDAQGRYRLAGLVKAPAYRISIHSTDGREHPYVNENRKVTAQSPGMEPVRFDIALKPGVEVRGRVVDKATGRPVTGTVFAFTFPDNPNLANYPGYGQDVFASSQADEDGRYRLVTVPGRGVLAFRADRDSYRNGLGVEAIPGYDAKWRGFPMTLPFAISPTNYHVLAEIRTKPGAEPTSADLQVESARSLDLTIVDPEGRPIGDLRAEGTSPQSANLSQKVPGGSSTVTVTVIGLEAGKPRRVTVFHDGRKLAGAIWLTGNETGRLTLRLQPWGTVVGRVVGDEEKPRKTRGLHLGNNTPGTKPEEVGYLPGGTEMNENRLDKDRQFRVEGLVPGLKYAASSTDGEVILGDLFKDVTVAPGETKDLGDLKVTPYRP